MTAWVLVGVLPLALTASPPTPRSARRPGPRPGPLPDIEWHPAPPPQGSLVVLSVKSGTIPALPVTGTLADEPLHFESHADSVAIALGAVPLSAADTVVAHVVLGAADTFSVSIPVAQRQVDREALRTAPRFTRRPDAALARRIARERARIADALAETHTRPRLWSEPFLRPRASAIRSEFGLEREFNGVVESRHLGVDFAGRRGDPVHAANRGVVTLVAPLFYSGRTIFIDHGAGLVTGYLHLDRALVAPGDTVARGQLIGRVGATGRVTGPHLHWLAHYGRILIDPLDLVTLDLTPYTGEPARARP
ncbi:MAG TPA: M23 family metallopeptidase [Gemmatimonadales bacterium]|nr:M23 family metallopeptidase [Gemmatimonadales bacterium]